MPTICENIMCALILSFMMHQNIDLITIIPSLNLILMLMLITQLLLCVRRLLLYIKIYVKKLFSLYTV